MVSPSESKNRQSAPEVIKQLGGKMIAEETEGPLYSAEIEISISGRIRRLGFIAQNHKIQNGAWSPNHHRKAAEKVRFFASHSIPLVTFIDTPGAVADAEANLDNQSHSISFLISEMANLQLPVIGVVFGCGYSGGAIPLATANILLSVREGVFNTIHPKGLSNIAHKYNLSWQLLNRLRCDGTKIKSIIGSLAKTMHVSKSTFSTLYFPYLLYCIKNKKIDLEFDESLEEIVEKDVALIK